MIGMQEFDKRDIGLIYLYNSTRSLHIITIKMECKNFLLSKIKHAPIVEFFCKKLITFYELLCPSLVWLTLCTTLPSRFVIYCKQFFIPSLLFIKKRDFNFSGFSLLVYVRSVGIIGLTTISILVLQLHIWYYGISPNHQRAYIYFIKEMRSEQIDFSLWHVTVENEK